MATKYLTLFTQEATLAQHVTAARDDEDEYLSSFKDVLDNKVTITTACKARALAACWTAGHHKVVDELMLTPDQCTVAEVLSMLKLVDGPRQIRQLERKLSKLSTKRSKAKRIKLVQQIQNLRQELPTTDATCASATGPAGTTQPVTKELVGANGALMKRVKKWAQLISAAKLEFFLLNFPTEPWKELSDLAHLKPDSMQLQCFLPVCFGSPPPKGTLLAAMHECNNSEDLPRLLKENPILSTCYSYLRKRFVAGSEYGTLCAAAKEALAAACPLEDVIWWYEELSGSVVSYGRTVQGSKNVEKIVHDRILKGESFLGQGEGANYSINYGKLMERLLLFKKMGLSFFKLLLPIAAAQLESIVIPTKARVAVMGDKSASMQVAVDSACVIGSVVSACLNAKLNFFDDKEVLPSVTPRSVEDVLKVCEEVRAGNCTAHAAALYPYYERKEKIDLFICVSDEGENRSTHGYRLAELFAKYRAEVHADAKMFLVSFLHSTKEEGHVKKNFERIGEEVRQFRFDPSKPDLSKLPTLLGMLAVELGEDKSLETMRTEPAGEQHEVVCQGGQVVKLSKLEAQAVRALLPATSEIPAPTLQLVLPKLLEEYSSNRVQDQVSGPTTIVPPIPPLIRQRS